jgi:hypothetical protein
VADPLDHLPRPKGHAAAVRVIGNRHQVGARIGKLARDDLVRRKVEPEAEVEGRQLRRTL